MTQQVFILGLEKTIPKSPFLPTKTLYDLVGHNTGNLAFHYAIDSHLGGGLATIDWGAPGEQIDRKGGVAILPCANQLGAHADYGNLAGKFANLESRLVAIGLGAQGGTDGKIPEVPKGSLEWVRAISQRAPTSEPNIAVRGPFTLEVLAHHGLAESAVVLGCPTLFINSDVKLGAAIANNVREPRRIAVTSGHQRWKHLAAIEASLVSMVCATGGSYVGQSPLEMVSLTRGEASRMDAAALAECRDYAAPGMDLDEFIRWSERHCHVFFDVSAWMEHYRRFDFVVGTRIHGVMLALQAGVPAMCIAHDSRTLELCRTMMVPHVLAKDVVARGLTRKSLLQLFQFDPDAFDRNRKELCRGYIRFLSSNGLRPVPWLHDIAASSSTTTNR